MKNRLKTLFKNSVPAILFEAVRDIYRGFPADNLTALATIHKTDKWGGHYYTTHYQKHFRTLRKKVLKILEIGVGGYDDPSLGGGSLRMWKDYFPKSWIYSIDIYNKSEIQEDRIRILQGSQNDSDFLRAVVDQMGGLDIVIDDGSHINEHVITSFHTLFPLLAEGGIYAIEDTQTSYWPAYGGDSYDLNNKNTIMGFLKNLTDGLNHDEIARRDFHSSYFDKNIISMHFYHNLVFIYKGRNEEGSVVAHEHIY